MSQFYKEFFGFKKDPFSNSIPEKQLLQFPFMIGIQERIEYALKIGAVMVLTGDVGSGKSTTLRWCLSQYHPSEVMILNLTASTGSLTEFYKQLCWALNLEGQGSGKAGLLKAAKAAIKDLAVHKKQKVILVVDEAHLLRVEILSEIHTLTLFDNNSKNYLGIVFSGMANLLDLLTYRSSMSLASRVVGKAHLSAISREQMDEYICFHTQFAGGKRGLFSENAILAIQQGSGGLLRKANNLAKGGLIAASKEKSNQVTAEHIRLASTELII